METQEYKLLELEPYMLDKEYIIKLANQIVNSRDDDYWLIMITPEGNIIIPPKDAKNHPYIALDYLAVKDPILCMMFDYYYGKDAHKQKSNDIELAYFALCSGYIDLDGYIDFENYKPECRYNPEALTVKTKCVEQKLPLYCQMQSSVDPEWASEEDIEKSKRLAWIRNRIKKDWKNYEDLFSDLDIETQISIFINGMNNSSERSYIENIEKQYESYHNLGGRDAE